MEYEYLIVGQGITGSILANKLAYYSEKFKIINYNDVNSSSNVAAGVMHPMALKRGTLSWRGKEFYEFSNKFYENFDNYNNTKYYKKHSLFRIFNSFDEQNNWTGKSNDDIYNSILSIDNNNIENINQPFGTGLVKTASRLNVKEFLEFIKNKYYKNISNNNFQFEEVKMKNKIFLYKGDSFKKIFMCEGINAILNPMFNYLPIISNKGELITVNSKNLPKYIINSGVFSLPLEGDKFTIGSTYNHRDYFSGPTKEAREELLKKINKITNLNDIQVLNQDYGFRPTTVDRKPLIGEHPIIKNLYIINGMGSKAVLMAPLLIKELLENIFNSNNIPINVDISRFYNKLEVKNIEYANSLIN
jgi:glycine oxidase